MNVALIQCPLWGTFDPPLALAQLSACLKKAGHGVTAFDLNIKLYLRANREYKSFWAWEQSDFWYNRGLVAGYCAANQPDIDSYAEEIIKRGVLLAGFSVNTASLHMSLCLAQKIKGKNPGVHIVFGGPVFLNKKHISEVLETPHVDSVIAGEGEYALVSLADSLSRGAGLSAVKGIAYRQEGQVVMGEPAPPVNLDELPFKDFSDLPLTDYDDNEHLPFMASRGCIRRCHFCSDSPCWPGYRAMSGKRIYQELAFLRDRYHQLGHIDFMDLAFNGNMDTLRSFCEMMIRRPLGLRWSANMVVRPELEQGLIKKMVSAGCQHVIFGIESGSERVLKAMNKPYSMADADRIIRQVHEAGMYVTANFMFGFPGETEEDFSQTLEFLRRNSKYLDRCYPSRTYFAIEEFSYVASHPEEFGIRPGYPNHLFWESVDGSNTYPVRMDRCRRFCELAKELGIEVGKGVQTSVTQDEWFNLAHYYETVKDYPKAIQNLITFYRSDPYNSMVNKKITEYKSQLDAHTLVLDKATALALEGVCADIRSLGQEGGSARGVRLTRETSSSYYRNQLKTLRGSVEGFARDDTHPQEFNSFVARALHLAPPYEDEQSFEDYRAVLAMLSQKNSRLNDWEFEQKRTILVSYPKAIFLQLAGPCNSSCVFCSRGHDYRYFSLSEFRGNIESKIGLQLASAEQFILTGSGEFLRLREWRQILDYLEVKHPHVEKMFSTNGSSLRPEVTDLITSQKSRYAIHASLHAASAAVHRMMTRMDNFEVIVNQIKYLIEKRKQRNNVRIDLFFVATTLNIEELPDFVRLAKRLGVDSVIVNYNYIYVPAQKYLSCYFKPQLTNRMFDEAFRVAAEVGIPIYLPPRFGEERYQQLGICRELWSQIMFNDEGHVLPCDASRDCNLRLMDDTSFGAIWNSEYYQNMRRELVGSGHTACFDHCHRANPESVNLFASHVIHRGRQGQKIDELWEDNF